MIRKFLAAFGLVALLSIGDARAQCQPVFSNNSALPACVGLQLLPVTVPSGKTITVESGASLICQPGSTCTGGTAATVPLSGITGLGTGVATALAVNVGTAGSIVTNGGALGTPASGVATNLTGTAAGLTAGNATTAAAVPVGGITGTGTGVNAALAIGVDTPGGVATYPAMAAGGNGVAYSCVTWTAGGTTVTRNVGYTAAITRHAAGDYTVTLGTALPAAATWVYGMYSATTAVIMLSGGAVPTTTTSRFRSLDTTSTLADANTYWACAF